MPAHLARRPVSQRSLAIRQRPFARAHAPEQVRERRRALRAQPFELFGAAQGVRRAFDRRARRRRVQRQQPRALDGELERVARARARQRRAQGAHALGEHAERNVVAHGAPFHRVIELLKRAVVEA